MGSALRVASRPRGRWSGLPGRTRAPGSTTVTGAGFPGRCRRSRLLSRIGAWAPLVAVLLAAACGTGAGDTTSGSAPSQPSPSATFAHVAATPSPTAETVWPTPGSAPTPATPLPSRTAPPATARSAVPGAASAAAGRAPGNARQAPQVGPAQLVTRGVTSRRAVALTFDAGADEGYAEAILDVLLYAGVRASFGMTGQWAEQHPRLVQRMALEGHQLINHSYDHPSFTGLSTSRRPLTADQRWQQLDRTEAIIQDLTGAGTQPFFRAPFGDSDAGVLRDIGARGYAYNVLWTVDSRGWLRYSAAAIIQRCLALAEPGAIYVFHVGSQSQDGPALPEIITGLRDAGYTFETVAGIVQESE